MRLLKSNSINILSIDTALRTCGVGVMRGGEVVFNETQSMPRGQDVALADAVDQGLKSAGVAMADLSAIVVTTGPGSFTGIRVGMAFARGLRSVLKIPLIGLTTAEVLSTSVKTDDAIAVLIEIKHDAYIAQIFKRGVAQTELMAVDAQELRIFLSQYDIKTIVTHSEKIKEGLEQECSVFLPDPLIMLEMARNYLMKNKAENVVVRPVYIRDADVTV